MNTPYTDDGTWEYDPTTGGYVQTGAPAMLSTDSSGNTVLVGADGSPFGRFVNPSGEMTVAFVGDSITRGSTKHYPITDDYFGYPMYETAIAATNIGVNFVTLMYPDHNCAGSDAVSVTWDGTSSFTCGIGGEAHGAAVDVTGGGFFHLLSSSNGKGIYIEVAWPRRGAGATDTGTVGGNRKLGAGAGNCWWYAGLSRVGMRNLRVLNFGIASNRPQDIAPRLQQVVDEAPTVAVLMCGINGVSTATTEVTYIRECIDTLTANVPYVVVCPVLPSGTLDATTAKQHQYLYLDTLYYAQQKNCIIYDGFSQLVNPLGATGTGVIDTNLFNTDYLHMNIAGGFAIGGDFYTKVLSKLFNNSGIKSNAGINAYDVTHNPYGNLLHTIGAFAGTSGTLGANPTPTGTLASSWTDAAGGATYFTSVVFTAPADGSPVARTDGLKGNWQRVACSTASGGSAYRTLSATVPNIAAATKYRASITLRITDATLLNKLEVYLRVLSGGTYIYYYLYDTGAAQTGGTITDTGALYLMTNEFTTPAALTNAGLFVGVGCATGGSVTLDIQDAIVEKVRV